MTEMLNARTAADLLGVDKRTLLRLAGSGKIRSYRTPGGQHRFRREDVESLSAGAAGESRAAISTVQNKREEVESLNLDVQARRAKRELARIESEDAESQRQRAEARRAEAVAQERALAEMRERQARETQERQAAIERETAERERRAWQNKSVTAALTRLPADLPVDERTVAIHLLSEELASFSPDDPVDLVSDVLAGASLRALAPYHKRKEIQQVIEDAEWALPWNARNLVSPTEWQIRFRAAADAAIRALSADASAQQICACVRTEARKLAEEFERSEARKEIAARAEQYLAYVGSYIEELGAPDGEWDLGDYFERKQFAERLTRKIRPRLVAAMLTGKVADEEDAQEFIEDAVDDQLDEE